MLVLALDHEILGGAAGSRDAGADARVAGLKRAVTKAGVIEADRFVKGPLAALVETVIDAFDPGQIRAELDLAAEIERDVYAEPILPRHGIDQAPEWRFAGERVVVADCVKRGRDCARGHAGERSRHGLCVQAGTVDYGLAFQRHGFRAADVKTDAVALDRAGYYGALERQRGTVLLRVSQIGEHQSMAVDDPG